MRKLWHTRGLAGDPPYRLLWSFFDGRDERPSLKRPAAGKQDSVFSHPPDVDAAEGKGAPAVLRRGPAKGKKKSWFQQNQVLVIGLGPGESWWCCWSCWPHVVCSAAAARETGCGAHGRPRRRSRCPSQQPASSQPAGSQPAGSQPAGSQPVSSQPTSSQPASAQPTATQAEPAPSHQGGSAMTIPGLNRSPGQP